MAAIMPTTMDELEGEKTIRPNFVRDEDERPEVVYNHFSDEIPVISLASFDDDQCSDIRQKMVEACESWGMFQIVDHGIDESLISDMNRLAREFFALPPEEKLRFHRSGGTKGGFFVCDFFEGELVQDWREAMSYFSYPVNTRDYSRWPDNPESWIKVTEEYSEKLMGLACKLLGFLSEALGLETDAFIKACGDIDQRVVANYYPKCPEPELTLGLRRHTDPGTITLLYQDHVGGFQATRDDGKTWITVQPVPGAFVFNIGDHGYYLSNGRFKSADHQAVVNSNCSRLSIATFLLPDPEQIVYPLAIGEGEKPILEEPITFAKMFKLKISQSQELVRLKNLAKEQQQLPDDQLDI